MNKGIAGIAGIAVLLACLSAGLCQTASADNPAIKVIRGEVIDIDWVASKLVVRTVDQGVPDEITLYVPRDTVITKGTDTVTLADINVSDNVTVEYYEQSFSGLRTSRITVQE